MSNNNLASMYARLVPLLNALQSPFALLVRIYVSWVFLKSGWFKLSDWGQTISLFESEYRLSAIGLFAVNALAVISYAHVLYQEGFEAAIGQHYLWGFMLLVIIIYGPGALSIDGLLARRSSPPRAV